MANFQGCWMLVRSSSVCAPEPEKMTITKSSLTFGTPCMMILMLCPSSKYRCLIVRHICVYMSAAIKATVHLICCTVDGSQFSLRSKKREIADRAVPLLARKIISYSSILYFLSWTLQSCFAFSSAFNLSEIQKKFKRLRLECCSRYLLCQAWMFNI